MVNEEDIEDGSSSDEETSEQERNYQINFDQKTKTTIEPIAEEDESNFKPTPAKISEKTLEFGKEKRASPKDLTNKLNQV